MNESLLIVAALLVLVFGAVSKVAGRGIVTPPMVFMLAGVLISPVGLGLLEAEPRQDDVALLATIALVIILCSDASQVDRREIRKIQALPIRLLAVGLPLTMLLGAGVAAVVFQGLGVGIVALVLLAVLLSPTDAALGQAVINSEAVPTPVREGLNVESGLNDGICLPPIFALLFLLGAELGDIPTDDWLRFTAQQIGFGVLAGSIAGFAGGRLIDTAAGRDWVEPSFQRLSMPAIAILAYALAEAIGGNGFISAFTAGFALGVKDSAVRKEMQEFGETEGTVLSLLVMLALGLVLIPHTLDYWSWSTTLYALLSLTVVRMLPVAICLIGLGIDLPTKLFIGWFGPRGIASILYLLMFVQYLGSDGYEALIATGVQTITLSVILHGLTAAPLASAFGRWRQTHNPVS